MRAVAEGLADRSDESYVDPFRVAETFARAGLADEGYRTAQSYGTLMLALAEPNDIARLGLFQDR